MSEPKSTLFAVYGGFADKRIKDLSKASLFIVDDRTRGDSGADKQLLSPFCAVLADVLCDDEVRIKLSGNVPVAPALDAWVETNDAKLIVRSNRSLTFTVQRSSLSKIQDLAQAIESIVAPGKTYPVSNYKYVCPRTARSLRKLEQALRKAWDA